MVFEIEAEFVSYANVADDSEIDKQYNFIMHYKYIDEKITIYGSFDLNIVNTINGFMIYRFNEENSEKISFEEFYNGKKITITNMNLYEHGTLKFNGNKLLFGMYSEIDDFTCNADILFDITSEERENIINVFESLKNFDTTSEKKLALA